MLAGLRGPASLPPRRPSRLPAPIQEKASDRRLSTVRRPRWRVRRTASAERGMRMTPLRRSAPGQRRCASQPQSAPACGPGGEEGFKRRPRRRPEQSASKGRRKRGKTLNEGGRPEDRVGEGAEDRARGCCATVRPPAWTGRFDAQLFERASRDFSAVRGERQRRPRGGRRRSEVNAQVAFTVG